MVAGITIFMVGVVPLVVAYLGGFHSIELGREHAQAVLIAQAVLDDVQGRVSSGLGRYYGPSDDAARIRAKVDAGAWRAVFAPLAEGRKKVVSADRSEVSTYFQRVLETRSGEQRPLDAATHPELYRLLERYWIAVSVQHDLDGAPIDSDGRNGPETDMCQVEVTVTWRDSGSGADRSHRLATLFTLEEYNRALDVR